MRYEKKQRDVEFTGDGIGYDSDAGRQLYFPVHRLKEIRETREPLSCDRHVPAGVYRERTTAAKGETVVPGGRRIEAVSRDCSLILFS